MGFSLRNPLVPFFPSLTTHVFILAFTSNASTIRPLGFIAMIFCVFLVVYPPSQYEWFTHPMYPNLVGGSVFGLALKYFGIVNLQGWAYEAGGPTMTIDSEPIPGTQGHLKRRSKWEEIGPRLTFAIRYGLECRYSGTPWEVRSVPPFDKRDPNYVPSRSAFIWKNAVRCAIFVTLLDVITIMGNNTSQNAVLFDQSRVHLFSRLSKVTTEEMIVKFASSLTTAVVIYLLLQVMYAGCGIITVALHITDLMLSRGGLSSASSRIYGPSAMLGSNEFWHQGMGTMLRLPAHYITTSIFCLHKRFQIGRYVYAMVVFQLSGLLHLVGDIAAGVPWRSSGVLHWFTLQAVGLALEDCFIALYRKMIRAKARGNHDVPAWQKFVGFIWICCWMVWSMPVWTYPIARASKGEGALPFSIIEHFRSTVLSEFWLSVAPKAGIKKYLVSS